MTIIHWQGEILVKCDPWNGHSEPILRSGRNAEIVADDDPRVTEWQNRIAREQAAAEAKSQAARQRAEARATRRAALVALRDGTGDLDRRDLTQALRLLAREVLIIRQLLDGPSEDHSAGDM